MKRGNNLEVTFLGEKELRISEKEFKCCKFYSVKPKLKKRITVNHHILLVDVSGSMYEEINNLKDRLKVTLEALTIGGNNYVSIILYSGHNETYRIVNAVKCDNTSYKMAQVYESIESKVYARGVTVMSEPLNEAIETARKLCDICDKHHIALFTDGCLVPLIWNVKTEEDKCLDIAKICNEKEIYLNAIGFGSYYDREFLKNLTRTSNTGSLMHIDEIKDYSETILNLVNEINNKEILEVEVNSPDFFLVKEAKRYNENSTLRLLEPNKNNIIVSIEEDLEVKEAVRKPNVKRLNKKYIEDFLYSLGLYYVINEDIDNAEVAIAQTGDIKAYSMVSNCYSFVEKGKAINFLTKLLHNKEERFINGSESIEVFSAENEPICLLEILREILEDDKSCLLWDFSHKYKRIGLKTMIDEEEFRFLAPKEGYGRVVDVSIGSKKLNIGIKVEIPGEVQNVKSKLKLDANIYKDYNLIVNGNINTPYLWCSLSRKLKIKFKKLGVLKKSIKWKEQSVSILDLSKVKATNKRTLRLLDSTEISQHLYDIEILKCKQWAINQLIKGIKLEKSLTTLDFTNMELEEREARRIFGVNEKNIYMPRKGKMNNESPYEVYPAIYLEWKVEKFPQKKYKENYLEDYQKYISVNTEESYNKLKKESEKLRLEKNHKELLINIVRLSSGLTNKAIFLWEKQESKVKTQTDKILNMNMVVGEKVDISTKVINDVSIREHRYIVLTKCN